MSMRRLGAVVLLAFGGLGCGTAQVNPAREAHGSLPAALVDPAPPTRPAAKRPTAILVERDGIRAIDPEAATQLWRTHLRVAGHPVASEHSLYVPLRGHKVAALDRRTGEVRWVRGLEGEALTGLAVSEPVLVASVIDGSPRARSKVVAFSTESAALQWQRPSQGRFGMPTTGGRVVMVPLDDKVVALGLGSGREVARVDADERTRELQRLAAMFPSEGTLGPGLVEAENLDLWLHQAANGEDPRSGVALARNAVISLRLDPDGRPARAKWIHRAPRQLEYIALDVAGSHVTLVREDGAIVTLDAETGEPLRAWAGKAPARDALLLDLDSVSTNPPPDVDLAPDEAVVHDDLLTILRDPDPRLLPARRLAADLLWRAESLETRQELVALAKSEPHPDFPETEARLRKHVAETVTRAWGPAGPDELAERMESLSLRANYRQGPSPRLTPLAEATVVSGTRPMVRELAKHLLHPLTRSGDLPALLEVLGLMRGKEADEAIATFALRYHADPDVIAESDAVTLAIDELARMAPESKRAQRVLDDIARDPFTDPALRVHVENHLRALP